MLSAEFTILFCLELGGWAILAIGQSPVGIPLIFGSELYFLARVVHHNFKDLEPDERASPAELGAFASLIFLELAGVLFWLQSLATGIAFVATAFVLMAAWALAGDRAHFRFPPTPFF